MLHWHYKNTGIPLEVYELNLKFPTLVTFLHGKCHQKKSLSKSNFFCNLKQNRTEQTRFSVPIQTAPLISAVKYQSEIYVTQLELSGWFSSFWSLLCIFMVEPAEFLVQLLMARGVMATPLPGTGCSSWQDAQDLSCVLLHSLSSVAAWGESSFF